MKELVRAFATVVVLAGCGGQTAIESGQGSGGASTLSDASAGGSGGSAGSGGAAPAATCRLNSDCSASLVCAEGLCRAQCAVARDCPPNQRCVASAAGNVCQLATESVCTYNSDCAEPLVCAKDRSCRNQCETSRDCVAGQVCAASKVCANPSEVDASGDVPTR